MARATTIARKPRRRLDAAAARELILDATEKRLVVAGPSGIRLQEVAADAGLSHPTVLHHFGNRDLLVKAVIERSLRALNSSLIEAVKTSGGDEGRLEAVLEGVAQTLETTGHARVLLWLLLEGHRIDEPDNSLSDVVDAVHGLRLAKQEGAKKPKREDTARVTVLAALALVGGAVLGPTLRERAGLGDDPPAGVRFRSWLARLLVEHLEGPGF